MRQILFIFITLFLVSCEKKESLDFVDFSSASIATYQNSGTESFLGIASRDNNGTIDDNTFFISSKNSRIENSLLNTKDKTVVLFNEEGVPFAMKTQSGHSFSAERVGQSDSEEMKQAIFSILNTYEKIKNSNPTEQRTIFGGSAKYFKFKNELGEVFWIKFENKSVVLLLVPGQRSVSLCYSDSTAHIYKNEIIATVNIDSHVIENIEKITWSLE